MDQGYSVFSQIVVGLCLPSVENIMQYLFSLSLGCMCLLVEGQPDFSWNSQRLYSDLGCVCFRKTVDVAGTPGQSWSDDYSNYIWSCIISAQWIVLFYL